MTQAHAFLFEGFDLKSITEINESEFNSNIKQHLKALRIRKEEQINILNGSGQIAQAICTQTQPYHFKIENFYFHEIQKPLLHLYLSPPRRESLGQTLSQSVEMGVSRITFIKTQHGDLSKKEWPTLVERAQRIVRAAVEQSQAPYLPKISTELLDFQSFATKHAHPIFFADEDLSKNQQLGLNADAPSKNAEEWGLLIGPEGGWSEEERQALLAKKNVYRLGLGAQILKVPTACVAALFYIQGLRV